MKLNHNLSDQSNKRNNKSICQDFLQVLKDIEQKERSDKKNNSLYKDTYFKNFLQINKKDKNDE